MQRIPISLAKAGMTLAKSVERSNGTVLLAEGTELTDSLVTRLPDMGVDSVVVQGHPVDMEGLAGGASPASRMGRMDHIFRRHTQSPWMMKLKKVFVGYFTMQAAAQVAAEQADQEARAAAEQAKRDTRAAEAQPGLNAPEGEG